MLYNLFRTAYRSGGKYMSNYLVNKTPLTIEKAEKMKARLIGCPTDSFQFYNNTEYIIQGIYPPTRQGFADYLEDNDLEEFGESFDDFRLAMMHNELYQP